MQTHGDVGYIIRIIKPRLQDVEGERLSKKIKAELDIEVGACCKAKLYACYSPYNNVGIELNKYIADAVLHECIYYNNASESITLQTEDFKGFKTWIVEAKKSGVTDDEGFIAQKAIESAFIDKVSAQRVFAQNIYLFKNKLTIEQLLQIEDKVLGNPLIYCFEGGLVNQQIKIKNPLVECTHQAQALEVDLQQPLSDLLALSNKSLWMFSTEELQAIKDYFCSSKIQAERQKAGLGNNPTDCEMEVLAQTWSEHCKHKEFAGIINYKNNTTGETKTIDSLFDTYIKGATSTVQAQLKAWGGDWLVKVFNDNAGLVRVSKNKLLAWKVETHNSPSALDPYGGSLTGIVGVNRDPLGTGVGGAKLIFNTNVLCFASPDYAKPLPQTLLHPKKIMQGVCKGIEDGGNKSGIPTVNGAVVFDDRFCGKPLVFCGTGAILPEYIGKQQQKSWEKNVQSGFQIFMAGGRVGSDGIHGATFSSVELNEASPRNAVQIGSPFTQKLLADFMQAAVELNLLETSTDNGAGGLSSSIGELAQLSNGAKVNIEKIPLKYAGLHPWEIMVSESQERMTLVVHPEKAAALMQLAQTFEVEIAHIGDFTNTGYFDLYYHNRIVGHVNLEFLHKGVPRKILAAEWVEPTYGDFLAPKAPNYNNVMLQLMGSINICSREAIIRRYDHEVQGKSILKPLMGMQGNAPQDAAVLRLDFNTWEGLAVACGICPKFADFDAYAASAGAFDEGIRQIISVGGMLPTQAQPNSVWSINDNFCVPDSVYHPEGNPDGKYKMGQLVQMCEALYDMSTYFSIPLTSGKDSMKNDFRQGEVKISIPPTVLYSFAVSIPDVRKVVSSEFKGAGDLIYLVGKSYNEMAGSEISTLLNISGGQVPKVRMEKAKQLYLKMMALHKDNLLQSSHDLSDGGLLVAAAESAIGGNLGINITLDYTDNPFIAEAFGESHSRFVVSVSPADKAKFEKIMEKDAVLVGTVTFDKNFVVNHGKKIIINQTVMNLKKAWKQGLSL